MAKLYPPQLENTIPAQTGTDLYIPFQFNRGTGRSEVKTLVALIKTVSTNKDIMVLYSDISNLIETETTTTIKFVAPNNILTVGQFYKIQLACSTEEIKLNDIEQADGSIIQIENVSSNSIGYYSTVGVFKYTKQAGISIVEETPYYSYRGIYDQSGANRDITERLYEYQFDLYKANEEEVYLSSGRLLHNNMNTSDTNVAFDIWNIEEVLDTTQSYTLLYRTYTVNKAEWKSLPYSITPIELNLDPLNYNLKAEYDIENARVNIYLEKTTINFSKNTIFRVMRASAHNPNNWYNLYDYTIAANSNTSELLIFTDYTVEQGNEYIYAVQQMKWEEQILKPKSVKQVSSNIYIDFEDMYLYDGKKQLKIRFNPKVSSFKTVVKDTKLETLGGQFPFIFRNGDVKYLTFSIGGLISYLMDNDELFIDKSNLGFFGSDPSRLTTESKQTDFNYKLNSTNLDARNIYAERMFKQQVMQWLNNGEVKLFRSPTEGNYLVRLMDINLTPNDTLSRMLHSFTCNAHEMAECNLTNLKKYILKEV